MAAKKTTQKRSRTLPFEPFATPWTQARPVPYDTLLGMLQKPVAFDGRTHTIGLQTAVTYAQHLRGLIPRAGTQESLAEALLASTPTGLQPTRPLISARRSAWLRFLAVVRGTPWETLRWPRLPAVVKQEARKRSTFKSWWTPRSLGIGIRWLCERARVHGVDLRPRDLQEVAMDALRTHPDGSKSLLISRAATMRTKRGKIIQGDAVITLPLARADLFVIAAMLHASWGEDAARITATERLLVGRLGVTVPPEKLGELYSRAGVQLFDAQSLCATPARADAIDHVTEAVGLTPMPDPGTPLDLWGSALATVLARVVIRTETLPGVVGAHAAVFRCDAKRALAVLQAFELVDRVTLRDRELAQVDSPVDPAVVEDAAAAANEIMDGVGAKRRRALRDRVNAWRRARDLGGRVAVGTVGGARTGGEAVSSDAAEAPPVLPPADLPPPVTPPPALPSARERSERMQRILEKRHAPYIPFSKAERGTVK